LNPRRSLVDVRSARGFGPALIFLAALPVLAPLTYLAAIGLNDDVASIVGTFLRVELVLLAAEVVLMAIGATVWALTLALPLAWIVERTDVPARAWLAFLTPLPLAVPPYVGALAYAALLERGGIVHGGIAAIFDRSLADTPYWSPIYGPVGAAFVLGLFTFPYIYLPAVSALRRGSGSLEEAARGLGLRRRALIWRVTLPLLRPALTAGALLVFVYVLVDFGVVSMLRVRTFTTAIYTDLLAGFDLGAAARLSLMLVGLVTFVVQVQRRSLGRAWYVQVDSRTRPSAAIALGHLRPLAFIAVVSVLALALVLPLGVLVAQMARFPTIAALQAFVGRQGEYMLNSVLVAAGGATLVVLLALVVASVGTRVPGGRLAALAMQAGYGVPGTVLGLALVGLYLRWLPPIYGTPIGIALAYVCLFGAHAQQSIGAALRQVSPSFDEAARGLGRGPIRATIDVVLPLAGPGILAGWLLVMVLALRELAATLILRPPGFDTLAVRVWVHVADVGPDPRAAAVALILTAMVATLWFVLLAVQRRVTQAVDVARA
jgi:iron(III) transport system permease protein